VSLPAIPSLKGASDRSLYVEVQKRYAAGPHSWFQLDVALTVRPGVTIVLGHSGAGKTTLLRSIAGLCDPEKGRITVAGTTLFDSSKGIKIEPARRKMAFVFQDLALFPHLNVYDNVSYGLRKLNSEERNRRVTEVLESFQIANLRKRVPREISGGEQQRVALARSLVTEPAVLLLDEPLSSLDPNTKLSIIGDLRAWNQARQIPMVYVTHNHEEVFALGEQVISLERGRIVAEGTPMDVVEAPHPSSMVQLTRFENLLEASVVDVRKKQGSIVCSLAGTPVEIHAPRTSVAPGDKVHVGIRADEILLAATQPAMLSACSVIHGQIRQINHLGPRIEAHIDCGMPLQVHLPPDSKSLGLKPGDDAWMIIRSRSCHLIRTTRLRASRRLFVFICNRNTGRSPVAEAICNAEIARRLKVPHQALVSAGVHAVSAGLSIRPGEPMSIEAQRALEHLQVPAPVHRSQSLTADLAASAELIFCMTESQQRTVMEMFPEFASKVLCLQHGMDLEDPRDQGQEAFVRLAQQIQDAIHSLMDALLAPVEALESPWGTRSRAQNQVQNLI
jgi:molybdate transport system ATP-binding protein